MKKNTQRGGETPSSLCLEKKKKNGHTWYARCPSPSAFLPLVPCLAACDDVVVSGDGGGGGW
jgi:hypothetical protein